MRNLHGREVFGAFLGAVRRAGARERTSRARAAALPLPGFCLSSAARSSPGIAAAAAAAAAATASATSAVAAAPRVTRPVSANETRVSVSEDASSFREAFREVFREASRFATRTPPSAAAFSPSAAASASGASRTTGALVLPVGEISSRAVLPCVNHAGSPESELSTKPWKNSPSLSISSSASSVAPYPQPRPALPASNASTS